MLPSKFPDNPKHAELAVTTNTNNSSFIKLTTPSSSSSSRRSSSSSASAGTDYKSDTDLKSEKKQEIQKINENKLTGRNMTPMHFLIAYNREILCFLTLFLTSYATFHNKYGARTPYYPINSRPIFDKDSTVEEFYKGQLTPLQTKVSISGISAILFYAPWSANSLFVKQYFEKLAKTFQNEIYFAAVNCWQPGGECRIQHNKVKSWPVLVVYYPKSLAVQYNGPWQLDPINKFLLGILRPIKRIHTQNELKLLNNRHTVIVVGFFSKIGGKYQSFYQSAVKWLEYDPLQDVQFCCVIGDVFKEFNVTNESEIQIFYRGVRRFENFSNWSVNYIVNSIKKYTKILVKYWNGYHRQDSESLEKYLKYNPSLLYFVERDYINGNNTAELILNDVIETYEHRFKPFVKSNIPLNMSKNHNENNKIPESTGSEYIITRKTKLNQNLSYFLLDTIMYYKLAFQFGLTNSKMELQQSTAVIVDNSQESIYIFPPTSSLTRETLKHFIEDYHLNKLKRNLRNKHITKSNQIHTKNDFVFNLNTVTIASNNVNIPEINGNKFHDLIQHRHTNNLTSVILITSKTCSLCATLKLNVLRISIILQNLPIIFYKIDGNNNDFIWEYTMGQYSTLLIVPKSKEKDVKVFPYNIEPNEKNILGFLMSNLDVNERLFGLLKYCEHLKISNGFYNCLKKARQIIDSIVNDQLKLWRNFSTRRKCIVKNLALLRNLYYQLLNSKKEYDIKSTFKILQPNHSKILKTNQIDIIFSCKYQPIEENIRFS